MPQTDGILALDLASVTGFAYGELPDSLPTILDVASGVRIPQVLHGTFRSGTAASSDGKFFSNFFNWLEDQIIFHNPRLVIFEAPILRGNKTAAQTARRLMGLATITDLVAHRRGVPLVREADLQTIKKHFAGHGHADKGAMIRRCHELGWVPEDDNAADAIALWHFASSTIIEKGWA